MDAYGKLTHAQRGDGMIYEGDSGQMDRSATFAKAFLAGLAAPSLLYAHPAAYASYVALNSVGQNFANVGALMKATYQSIEGGEEQDERETMSSAATKLGSAARAAEMTPERRAEIAKKAAAKRWDKD